MSSKLISLISRLTGVSVNLYKGTFLLPVRYQTGEEGMVIPLPALNDRFHELVITQNEDGEYVLREVTRGIFVGQEEEVLREVGLGSYVPVYVIKDNAYGLTFEKSEKEYRCAPFKFQRVLESGVRYCFKTPIGVSGLSLDFEDSKMYYTHKVEGFHGSFMVVEYEQIVVGKGKVEIKYVERNGRDIAEIYRSVVEGREQGKKVNVRYDVSKVSVYSTFEKTYFVFEE